MSAVPPIPMMYEGAGRFSTRPNFARIADEHYGAGEIVSMVPHEDRSEASHGHQFAWLKEAWLQLPEGIADEHPSPEHLRKWGLVKAGYYDEQIIDAGSNAAALRVATGIKAFPGEGFSAVVVRGPLVVIRRPKSQSHRAMGRETFQASKTALLEVVADLIGVAPEDLTRNAARAA